MRPQLDANQIVFVVEEGDTVDDVARCISLLSGPADGRQPPPTEQVEDRGEAYAIHVQPHDERSSFTVIVPKSAGIDPDLRLLCSAYIAQQDSPD